MNRLQTAQAFLRAAQEDIAVAKLAHGQELSRACIYHLGQAVEKTSKAYLLGYSDVEADSLKTHDGVFLYTTFLKWAIGNYKQPLESLLQITKSSHTYSEKELELLDIPLAEKKIKDLRGYASKPRAEKERLFPTYLEESHRNILGTQLDLCENFIGVQMLGKVDDVAGGLGMIFAAIPGFLPEYLESAKAQLMGAMAANVLSLLCGVFIFHDQDPRYPPLVDPPDTRWASYQQGTPIVDGIPRLLHIIERSHQLVSEMIAGFNSTEGKAADHV